MSHVTLFLTAGSKNVKRKSARTSKQQYVHGLTGAADAIGFSRRQLHRWKKDHPDFPKARSDNRYFLPDIFGFLKRHEELAAKLRGLETPKDTDAKAFWDCKNAKLKFERDLHAFDVEKSKHISTAEIAESVGRMLHGFRAVLNRFPGKVARRLVGAKDFHAIREKLQDDVDAVLRQLNRCQYLENLTPAAIEKLFSDRDPEFREDLMKICAAVFTESGRLALSELLQREIPA